VGNSMIDYVSEYNMVRDSPKKAPNAIQTVNSESKG
jgi:hypothetical protein